MHFATSKKCTKAELPQVDTLFHTQFPSLRTLICKEFGFRKNKKMHL